MLHPKVHEETEEERIDRLAEEAEHVLPAVEWALKQEEGKRFCVRLTNFPRSAKEANIRIFLKKNISTVKIDTTNVTIKVEQ